jgi:hypothetical protein
MHRDPKYIALQLCSCTWIEIMTGAGITFYLLSLNSYMLAAITAAVFAPLICFHFVMVRVSKSDDYCSSSSRCIKHSSFSNKRVETSTE